MESFTLTRKEMSTLLLSLQGASELTPLSILQRAWTKNHQSMDREGSVPSSILPEMPHIIEKLLKGTPFTGFSLHEIADLGHLIEHSNVSITSIQNWVKRDFKEMFITTKEGRKYAVNQAALLYIIDDLKSTLDFLSIRKLFQTLFFSEHQVRGAYELIEPIQFYHIYATMFEEMDGNNDQVFDIVGHGAAGRSQDSLLEKMVQGHADRITQQLTYLSQVQQKIVSNVLVIASLSVQTSYLHSISKKYYNATMFLEY